MLKEVQMGQTLQRDITQKDLVQREYQHYLLIDPEMYSFVVNNRSAIHQVQ